LRKLQLEAARAALDGDEAQERRELLLVLRIDERGRVEDGRSVRAGGSLALELKRTAQRSQLGIERTGIERHAQLVVAERRHR